MSMIKEAGARRTLLYVGWPEHVLVVWLLWYRVCIVVLGLYW